MAFLPNLFLSNLKAKGGPAKNNRYEVMLPIPPYIAGYIEQSLIEQFLNLPTTLTAGIAGFLNGNSKIDGNPAVSRYLALQCEHAELPGKSLMTHDVKVYGPSFKVPYTAQYQPIQLTFICTNDFYERKLFDRWLEAIIPNDTHNTRFAKDESTRYMTNITITQYDDFIKQIYAIKLIDAFPISIASQELSWSNEGFHRVTVEFAYQKYETVYEGTYDLVSAASALLGDYTQTKIVDPLNKTVANIIGSIF